MNSEQALFTSSIQRTAICLCCQNPGKLQCFFSISHISFIYYQEFAKMFLLTSLDTGTFQWNLKLNGGHPQYAHSHHRDLMAMTAKNMLFWKRNTFIEMSSNTRIQQTKYTMFLLGPLQIEVAYRIEVKLLKMTYNVLYKGVSTFAPLHSFSSFHVMHESQFCRSGKLFFSLLQPRKRPSLTLYSLCRDVSTPRQNPSLTLLLIQSTSYARF